MIWLLRDNRNLLSRIRNGRGSNGMAFEEIDFKTKFDHCPVIYFNKNPVYNNVQNEFMVFIIYSLQTKVSLSVFRVIWLSRVSVDSTVNSTESISTAPVAIWITRKWVEFWTFFFIIPTSRHLENGPSAVTNWRKFRNKSAISYNSIASISATTKSNPLNQGPLTSPKHWTNLVWGETRYPKLHQIHSKVFH